MKQMTFRDAPCGVILRCKNYKGIMVLYFKVNNGVSGNAVIYEDENVFTARIDTVAFCEPVYPVCSMSVSSLTQKMVDEFEKEEVLCPLCDGVLKEHGSYSIICTGCDMFFALKDVSGTGVLKQIQASNERNNITRFSDLAEGVYFKTEESYHEVIDNFYKKIDSSDFNNVRLFDGVGYKYMAKYSVPIDAIITEVSKEPLNETLYQDNDQYQRND